MFDHSVGCLVHIYYYFKNIFLLGWACNLSTLGGRDRWITWGQEFETSLRRATWWNPVSTKNTKISQVCGGACLWSQLLGRLRWEDRWSPAIRGCCELWLHHCTPAWVIQQDSTSKKKKEITTWNLVSLTWVKWLRTWVSQTDLWNHKFFYSIQIVKQTISQPLEKILVLA